MNYCCIHIPCYKQFEIADLSYVDYTLYVQIVEVEAPYIPVGKHGSGSQ